MPELTGDQFARFDVVVKLRRDEAWAAACLEAALPGVGVRQYDDNSREAMHDLDIVRGETLVGACEVTSAADGRLIGLWNEVNGPKGRHIESGLQGGWTLSLKPACRRKKLMAGIRPFLEDLESRQITQAGWYAEHPDVEVTMDALGIDHVFQSPRTSYPGSVYFMIDLPSEMSGGAVPETGDPLCEWLEGWVADPSRARKVDKLLKSAAPEKHLFVILPSFSEAPFVAFDPLMRNDGPLPTKPLELPDGLTHLWVMSMWSDGDLFAWEPANGWARHEKVAIVPSRLVA